MQVSIVQLNEKIFLDQQVNSSISLSDLQGDEVLTYRYHDGYFLSPKWSI